ncbi:hypothetical protein ScPMuIL_015280 [Solemya velum]
MVGSTDMILILLSILSYGLCEGPHCCDNINSQECRQACERLVVSSNQIHQIHQLVTAAEHCPADVVEFWQCMKISLPVIEGLEVWSGRPCCGLALTSECREACKQGLKVEDLGDKCRQSWEASLYSCIERQENGEHCCKEAKTPNCKAACWSTYLSDSLSKKQQRQLLQLHCQGTSRTVNHCIHNHANRPNDSLHCCEQATTNECKLKCRRVLTTMTNDQDIIEELMESCGQPLPVHPLWQCFLSSNQRNEEPLEAGIDGAKLQCCKKAITTRCRNLCIETYSTGWTHRWNEFHQRCQDISSPISVMEAAMHNCLAEVDEPCMLGCNGLSYCDNFNNRPTEFFRSCNAQSDKAAENDSKIWSKGRISLPQLEIPILIFKDIENCEPEMWKAVACALQIKPCHKKPSPLSICREDCLSILNKCVDPECLPYGQTVQVLCNSLSPDDSRGSCISIKKYTSKSQYAGRSGEVSNPCNPNPCDEGQICQIRHRKCKHADKCEAFICKSACPMGEVSTVLVPRKSYVRIPVSKKGNADCEKHKVCQCGAGNVIQHCSPMPCLKASSCTLMGPDHIKEHGSNFRLDCNHCVCHSGDLICTKRLCHPGHSTDPSHWTGMPCGCLRRYMPVCGVNGKTYPNSCLAKCNNLNDNEYTAGSCDAVDPCDPNPCDVEGTRCVPHQQVCLSLNYGQCRQYDCVPLTHCNHHSHEPVCDVQGEEFTNICLLFSHHRKLAHRGHCLNHCAKNGVVCGYNGETYPSECAALADRSMVDYSGPCRVIGYLTASNLSISDCPTVECPRNEFEFCEGIIPPGACCPICAAELRVLYSPMMSDMAAQAMGSDPINVAEILEMLSNHLTVAECDVFGYLSIEGDLVILLYPVTASPTDLQVQACIREAERMESLIRTGSPTLMSYLKLTPLLLATVRTPELLSTSDAAEKLSSPAFLIITTLLLTLQRTYQLV